MALHLFRNISVLHWRSCYQQSYAQNVGKLKNHVICATEKIGHTNDKTGDCYNS